MLSNRYIGVQLFLIVCVLSLLTDVNASILKEFGKQHNIYLTDWARLKHQAELGDPNALFVLGNYYYQPPKGSGFKKDLKKSAQLYFKSGLRGNASAQYNLALMLHQGLGVTKDRIESYVWFKLAAYNQSLVAKHINQVSAEASLVLEEQFNANELSQANKKFDFYVKIIDQKLYRKAHFPD